MSIPERDRTWSAASRRLVPLYLRSDGWALEVNTLGAYVKPTLIDYDIDGDVDLIVANGAGNIFLFVQGGCASDCTTSGSCNVGTEQMPTCSCSFAGATDGRSCNSW